MRARGDSQLIAVAYGAGSKGSEMNEQEVKKEIAQAKEELLEAKTKLKELSAQLKDLWDVMEKIDAAQGRLQKGEEKLFLESQCLFMSPDSPRDNLGTLFSYPGLSSFAAPVAESARLHPLEAYLKSYQQSAHPGYSVRRPLSCQNRNLLKNL